MRYAPLRERRNIRRVDYQKKNGQGKTALWQVFFDFKHGLHVSQSFSDSKLGGKEKALLSAMRFRNAVEQELAAAEIVYGHTGRIRTDAVGISRSRSVRRNKTWWYWQATWPGIDGRAINRKFHDLSHGGSGKAKQMALQARAEGVEHYRAIREGRILRREVYPAAAYGAADGRAPYSLFMPPPNPDIAVWRYMDFTKLVSLLEQQAIYFPTISELHDPFEGSFARGNQVLRPLVYRHFENKLGLPVGELSQRLRHVVAASCWHMNEHESAGMWKLYAKTNEAVCIQSTFRKLRDVLGAEVRVGTVRYVDYETEWIPESNPFAPFLYKRKSFEHEREVRALLALTDLRAAAAEPPKAKERHGCFRKIDLTELVERIYIAPDAPDWFADLVRSVVKRYEQDRLIVLKSSLATSPIY